MAALPAKEETQVKEGMAKEMEGIAAVKQEDTKVLTSKGVGYG